MFSTTLANINKYMKTFIENNVDDDEAVLEQWNDKSNQTKLKAIGKKVKKEKKDPDAPKGKLNAYMFFCKDMRSTVVQENPNMKPKEILSELGSRWNQIKETREAKKYQKLAEADKIRYNEELERYKRRNEGSDDEEEKHEDLNTKTMSQLRAMCDDLGIAHSQKKKKELVDILTNHRSSNGAGAGAEEEEDTVDYSTLSVKELKDAAIAKGIDVKGKKKAQLIIELESHSTNEQSGEESESESSGSESESESEEDEIDLSSLSRQQLVAICKKKGISTAGKTNAALIIALEN
jgi:hypothetical protein